MKIYLAAPYGARDEVREFANQLTRIGFKATSSWLTETHEINAGTQGAATDLDDAQVSAHAVQDLQDIRYSDLLVLFTAKYLRLEGGGGRHVETGFALALNKPVLVVGEPENVFHRLKGGWSVDVAQSWHEAVIELSHRLVQHERQSASAEVSL